jgi:chemotaxis-related protein WspB
MLFLLFRLGEDRYAIDAACVSEVLPLVDITRIPWAPDGIVGICDYRGAPLPVIDLSQLRLGRPAQRRLSTRLIIGRYTDDAGQVRSLGLLAENATEILRREPHDFVDSGVAGDLDRYLGPVSADAREVIQRVDFRRLLPPNVRDALFTTRAER